MSLEKQLATKILALLDIESASAPTPTPAEGADTREAAQALYEGVDAADRGNVGEALSKFEAAMEREPKNAEAHRRYERVLRSLDAETLWSRALGPDGRAEDRLRVGARILDDLFTGLVADIRALPAGDLTADGTVWEVQLGFDDLAIQRLRQEIARLQGRINEQAGRLVLEVDQPEIRAAFTRSLAVSRRAFLHLGTADGRQVVVYSQLRQWDEHQWVSLDAAGRLIVEIGQHVVRRVVLPDLHFDGPSWPTTIWVSVDPVPHEAAILQVDLLALNEEGREVLLGPAARTPRTALQESDDDIRAKLTQELLEIWNPPVWEHVPGPGYLPSSRRSVIVVAQIRERHLQTPHLADSSGDPAFDQACLGAVTHVDARKLAPLLARLERGVSETMRVRVSCDLIKDIPPLHESR